MAALPLLRDTKMAAVTSRENTPFSKMSAKRVFRALVSFSAECRTKVRIVVFLILFQWQSDP